MFECILVILHIHMYRFFIPSSVTSWNSRLYILVVSTFLSTTSAFLFYCHSRLYIHSTAIIFYYVTIFNDRLLKQQNVSIKIHLFYHQIVRSQLL
jgi:hypothetical protein